MWRRNLSRSEDVAHLRCVVMFVGSGDGGLLLDCVATEPVETPAFSLATGGPFALQVRLPDAAWAAAAIAALERWADESRVVDLEFRNEAGRARVHASDGTTRMLLDG
jgi:hypothetical protein